MLTACALLLLALGCYAVLCAIKPFAPCRRCTGRGEIERFGKARTCPRCCGDRLRLRVGRRAHNRCRRTYDDGTR